MGGGGASSMSAMQNAGGSVQGLNDSQLSAAIRETKSMFDEVGDHLEELAFQIDEARRSPKDGRAERVQSAQRAYNEGSDLFNQLRDRLSTLEDERDKRKHSNKSVPQRRFVNSYGEATTRYITSQSYENSQRRLKQRIDSWMRGR